MSLHLEMLQVARLSPKLLGEATASVTGFLESRLHEEGGFVDRDGRPDLYYTVFGLAGLRAINAPLPVKPVKAWLRRLVLSQPKLDFVHLCSLARCVAAGDEAPPALLRRRLLDELETYRAADGGYHNVQPHAAHGTAYGCFLALGAHQDFGTEPPDKAGLGRCLKGLLARDGAYANAPGAPAGSTNATAAAIAVLHALGLSPPEGIAAWLLARRYARGGFFAAPAVPVPDLLSTATGLHALTTLGVSLDRIAEAELDFLDSLWSSRGGFHGHWADDELDCEYTFYGLLALGHLSLYA